MYMKRSKVFVVFLVLTILFNIAAPVFGDTAAKPHKKVTVAFVEQTGLLEKDEEGNLSGYTYDYLMKMAQYADWDVEFVFPKNKEIDKAIVEMMEKVAAGEVDLISAMVYSEDSEKVYSYPKKGYGYAFTTLLASKSDTSINEDNLALRKNLKVAVIDKADTRNEELDAFCKSNNTEYTEVKCETAEEQLAAIKSGKADVMVSLSLLPYAGTKIVASFADRPFYFTSKKGNQELCDEIDRAIEAIEYAEPDYRKDLHDKYFADKEGECAFSKEGLAYIAKKKTLKVLVPEEIKPLQSQTAGGAYEGIFVSFMKRLTEATGLKVKLYSLPKGTSLKEAMASGDYDMTLAVPEDYEWADENGLIFSVPLLTSDKVLFYDKSVDISDLSKLKRSKTGNLEKQMKAVESGDADYGYGSSLVVNYNISNNAYQEIATLPVSEEESNYVCSFNKDASLELIAVVNEVIENVDPATMNAYILESSQIDNQDLLTSWIRKNPIRAVGIVTAFVVLIICLAAAVIFNKRKQKENVMLLKANNAKSEFLSKMSHEMRTPLNAIVGVTALAEDEVDHPLEMREHLKAIDDASGYLLRLINDVLDMAKIESGEFSLSPSAYTYQDFERTIRVMMEPLCKQKEIDFVCDYDIDKEDIFVDKVRFDQIFINLLTNAVKFTPEKGRVEFTIRADNNGEGYQDSTFIIRDTGIGMSEEFQKNLFEPFTQERNDGSGGGTGLGLAIAKSIVDMMGGTFVVESEENVGTTVTIKLKLQLAAMADGTEKTELEKKPDYLKGKKILLVEDNLMNREIAKKLLLKKEIEVICAVNGKDAVQQFEESPEGYFDGILMDIRMPEMDGLTATSLIRSLDREDGKNIPIIAMTADAFEEDKEKAKAAGITSYLAKPVNVALLYETLENLI